MPNWKSAPDYAFTSDLDDAGWTWEFLRRNEEYVGDYGKATAFKKKSDQVTLPDPESKVANASNPTDWWSLGAKWWINGPIRDPAHDKPPKFFSDFPWEPNLEQVEHFFRSDDDATVWEEAVVPHDISKVQKSEFAILVFDLRKPLAVQIDRAHQVLSKRQAALDKPLLKPPPHKGSTNWRVYLRLLDARKVKATHAEIAAVIFKNQLGHQHGYDPIKKIEKQIARARALQKDPLALLSWSHPVPSA